MDFQRIWRVAAELRSPKWSHSRLHTRRTPIPATKSAHPSRLHTTTTPILVTKSTHPIRLHTTRTPIPPTKSAHQSYLHTTTTPIPVTKSAHRVDCGRPVGLGSVGRLNWISSLAFRVKGRRKRFWPPSRFRVRRPSRFWPPSRFRVRPLSQLDHQSSF